MKYNRTGFAAIFAGVILIAFQSSAWAAKKNFKALALEIDSCSSKSEDSARLECFDSIAKTLSKRESQKNGVSDSLPENLGGGRFDDTRARELESRGLVKSCKKSYDGKWFFIFDNGQVWKQVDADHRRYKECNFNVTIKKDGFGYKMQIDGQTRKIRIKRHR